MDSEEEQGGPGRPRGGSSEETRQRILDAAEVLFSASSFNGVTLRQVAREAGVDTALLHYYFKNKRGLFDAVFERRAIVLNSERLASLAAYELQCRGIPSIEGTLNAFLEPLIAKAASGDPRWRNYFAMISQVSNTPEIGGELMSRNFDPVVERMLDLLRKALPGVEIQKMYWGYQMLSGAIMLTLAQSGRIDKLSNGLCRSGDLTSAFRQMIPFATAGFQALLRD